MNANRAYFSESLRAVISVRASLYYDVWEISKPDYIGIVNDLSSE